LSLADIGTFVALASSRTLGVPIDPGHAHLSAWYLRVGTRIVVKKEFDAIRRAAAQA
jgi:hypothetical protein